jgi:hypothetical protein
MTDVVRFKDFSLSPEPIVMRIAPDDFKCYPEIPLDVIMELAEAAASQVSGPERVKQMQDLLEGVMEPVDYATFSKRLKKGTPEQPNPFPIGMRHIREILPWLMEVYGLRPTQESDSSVDGSGDDDTSSTDGVSPTESTS